MHRTGLEPGMLSFPRTHRMQVRRAVAQQTCSTLSNAKAGRQNKSQHCRTSISHDCQQITSPGHRRQGKRLCCRSNAKDASPWQTADDEDVVLVADIGGTNCRFVLWRLDLASGNHDELVTKVYPTKSYQHFDDALEALASEQVFQDNTPGAAAFACAGPVLDNRCVMTNLSWVIDGDALTRKYGIRMAVLNDFEACGYGVPALKEKDVVVLNDVRPRPKGPKAVMGPGTGLGQANLYWSQNLDGYRVWPSEGSHASFAPRGWKQRALQTFVERQLGYCEVEHVACGSGLERIYQFLQTDEACIRPHLDLKLEKTAADISGSGVIEETSEGGFVTTDPLAVEAVDLFCALIGAEAGHMGLRSLATGGVYICGGIMPKLMGRVATGGLLDSYLHESSRFNKLLRTFPLYVVINEGLGLLGTREYAIRLLQDPEVCLCPIVGAEPPGKVLMQAFSLHCTEGAEDQSSAAMRFQQPPTPLPPLRALPALMPADPHPVVPLVA